METAKMLYDKAIEILTSKRMVATYWHAGTMLFAALSDIILQNLTAWNPDTMITVGAGLVFAQITKHLNTK